MEIKKFQGAIEAILFSSGDPVSIDRIADVLELDKSTAAKMLQNLMDEFNREYSGIHIVKLEDQYQMCSNPQYAEPVRRILDMRRNTPLSQAGMEVLAIIAYNQPVTKAFVEQVRGVDCSGVLGSLTAKGLIEERGRLELPGRPLLYGTTPNFLRCLNISSLNELPPLEKSQQSEAETEEMTDVSAG
ncbi:SMC-Scp complex subunit ScpB [Caproiciproducens faecalis]|uniref:Segregation and condensation protein B n=1 Tax=Caproiciproducens faecalis TaxID=2820301 RepID=A0ABS7DRQ1_9FIRM|nr:SMC-Scp complex subunit ScpB [Caproiciproducens faecalis]MBW7573988.1 SMC-Scp complex subunit ScpB [Caproiciproducens faecalis]